MKKNLKEISDVIFFIGMMVAFSAMGCFFALKIYLSTAEDTTGCFYHEKIGTMASGESIYDTIYVNCPTP